MSAPLPHLIQIREGGRSRVINQCTIRKWLSELANNMALTDTDGTALHFTPHDFRRIFITDIVNAGFPSTWPHRLWPQQHRGHPAATPLSSERCLRGVTAYRQP